MSLHMKIPKPCITCIFLTALQHFGIKKGDRLKAGLPGNQSRARVDTGLIILSLVRLAVAVTSAAVVTLGTWFRFVDFQRASVHILAVKATNGGSSLFL